MAEYLYYFLPVHHFLNVSLGFAHALLLTDKELRAAAADNFRDDEHKDYAAENYQGEPKAEIYHHKEYGKDNGNRTDERRESVVDEFP